MSVGVVFMGVYDVFTMINESDVTKISFLIMALFIILTARVGMLTYNPTTMGATETAEWFSDKFLMLGMIGTVIGFIYMLKTCFGDIDVTNPATMQSALKQMSYGMGTALFTTAAGLVCSLLLKLQIFNLRRAIHSG
jgi:hypothetical protein